MSKEVVEFFFVIKDSYKDMFLEEEFFYGGEIIVWIYECEVKIVMEFLNDKNGRIGGGAGIC